MLRVLTHGVILLCHELDLCQARVFLLSLSSMLYRVVLPEGDIAFGPGELCVARIRHQVKERTPCPPFNFLEVNGKAL